MTRNVTKTTLCSTLAIATAMVMGPRPAMAQAFIGTVNSSSANVINVDQTIANQTNVSLSPGQSVINWDATGVAASGVKTFQPNGTTATFSSVADFAVLNRVNASGNAIKLDGTINSQVGNFVGGTVYFSSADGIIVGSNAVINVGSLGLTTLPILDVLGNWMTDFGGIAPQVTFGAAANPAAGITTAPLSELNANGPGNYVALVSPTITHSGRIRTDGGAALVAANGATITFRPSNLYDISMNAPGTGQNPLTINGGIISRNTTAIGGDHRAYLTTITANDANTMLITGGAQIGFDIAGSAGVEDNAVVLSAGGPVFNGDPYWDINAFGRIGIDNASFTSNTKALGRNGISITNATGGTAFAGDATLFTQGGDITIASTTGTLLFGGNLNANASFFGSNGQNATANSINMRADGASASITVLGDTNLVADGHGGSGNSDFVNGGNGIGGTIGVAAANNATVDLRGSLTASARGYGGSPQYGSGGLGGSGTGGSITLAADVGATSGIIVRGLSSLRANGYGGGPSEGDPVTGGLGTGGTVAVRASGSAGNFVQADANLLAEASGIGGSGDIAGGNGTGGTVTVSTFGGASLVLHNPQLNAVGQGGSSFTGAGGSGRGGNATLQVSAGSVTLTGNLLISTSADGGSSNGGTGGMATGGQSHIYLFSPSANLTVGGTTTLYSSALGGFSLNGNGGAATGGFAEIYATGGTAHFVGDTVVQANATGGGSTNRDGATGTGGRALLQSLGSAFIFDGALSTHADATGGNGVNGGNAIGAVNNGFVISGLVARNGGSISVAGGTNLTATTVGGTAHDYGHGGNAVGSVTIHDINGDVIGGGLTGIIVKGGASAASSVALAGLIVDTSALGGAGGFGAIGLDGGTGGSAIGGEIGIVTRNSDIGTNLINADSMSLTADARGGNGGFGGDGPSGLAGGGGGDATSGFVSVLGSAGNGSVVTSNLTVAAVASGGSGGLGGNAVSPSGATGNGGNGGNATASGSAVGAVSVGESVTNYGSARFGNVTVFTSAHGGTGGNAGSGSPTLGSAGNGGSAWGGNSTLYSRGADVQVGSMTVDARALGGNGGFSNIGGFGGNAHAGSIIALSTTRYLHPEQAGTLVVVGAFSGDASAYGGSGLTNGTATIDPSINTGVGIEVLGGSTAQFGSFSPAQFAADGTVGGARPSFLHVVDSTLNVTNGLSIVTDGVMQVLVDSGSVTAGSVNLYAGDFTHSVGAPPTLVGTITADQFNIGSANNIILDASLNSTGIGNSLSLNAPGLVSVYNLTSVNNIAIWALGDITVADLVADLSSNPDEPAIRLNAGGSVLLGDAIAAGRIKLNAGGTVTGGDITTGLHLSAEANGAINLGAISAGLVNPQGPANQQGFSVGISSGTSISVGNVAGAEAIGFATLGALTTGNLNAGTDVLGMAGGNMSFGAITAGVSGRTYLADSSMFIAAGGPNNFNPALVFAATPVPSSGSITILGPVSTGSFQAAGASISAGNITANSFIQMISTGAINFNSLTAGSSVNLNAGGAIDPTDINAGTSIDIIGGGAITLGNLTAGTYIDILGGGNLTTGNVLAGQKIRLDSGGAISTGSMTAGGSVQAKATGNIITGVLSAGLINPWLANPENYVVALNGGGSVTTGNIASLQHVGLAAGGTLSTGTIDAGGIVLALVSGNMSFGAINAGGPVYLADRSMMALGGDITNNFDPAPVLAAVPVRSGGNITTGAISGGNVTLAATGAVTLPSAAATGFVSIAGGDVTAGSLSGNSIDVTATGLASVNGRWQGGPVTIVANDLAISADGSVKGGAVRIESTNANGMFLGDGLTGTGFMLSQAEADRISGTQIAFASLGGQAPTMTIGNLALSAAQMTGAEPYRFDAGGSIKVVGHMTVNGLVDPATSIGFYTPLFMLDESIGSLALNNGSQLGGTLNIHAHDVWVADSTILARLLADPNYAGRDAELAVAPTGVSGAVISANVINVTFENGGPRTVTPYTLLVQNTGDATTQQGFLATDANAVLGTEVSGLIDMVINGQGQGPNGLVNGAAVRDALMAGDDPTRFTATSTINGCSVAGGPCGAPPPPIADPGVVLADEIVLFSIGADDKPLFGNEEQIVNNYDEIFDPGAGAGASDVVDQLTADAEQKQKEEDEADAASSPIEPPNPLFDSRPLNAKDSTDEPISGGGNPALIGSDIDPTTGGQ